MGWQPLLRASTARAAGQAGSLPLTPQRTERAKWQQNSSHRSWENPQLYVCLGHCPPQSGQPSPESRVSAPQPAPARLPSNPEPAVATNATPTGEIRGKTTMNFCKKHRSRLSATTCGNSTEVRGGRKKNTTSVDQAASCPTEQAPLSHAGIHRHG